MATLSQIRRMNQRKVVKLMMRLGSASRAQLAKATGMSQATIGRIVDDLLENEVLAKSGAPGGGSGPHGAHGTGSAEGTAGTGSASRTSAEITEGKTGTVAG